MVWPGNEQLIERLERAIASSEEAGDDENDASWEEGHEAGVLLTRYDAKYILNLLRGSA